MEDKELVSDEEFIKFMLSLSPFFKYGSYGRSGVTKEKQLIKLFENKDTHDELRSMMNQINQAGVYTKRSLTGKGVL